MHQAGCHIFYDSVTILHDCSSNLQVLTTQSQEFSSISPSFDTTDTGQVSLTYDFVLQQICNKSQGDRLNCSTGVTGNGGLTIYYRHSRHIFKVDVRNGFDGVDRGYTSSSAFQSSSCRNFHRSDVWSHLSDERNLSLACYCFAVLLNQFRICTNVRTHSVACHLRTGEVTFNQRASQFVTHLSQLFPFFFAGTHDGSYHNVVRIVSHEFVHVFKVNFCRFVGNLFHVFETNPRKAFLVCLVESWGTFVGNEDTNGLVHNAAPSSFKTLGNHFIVASYR